MGGMAGMPGMSGSPTRARVAGDRTLARPAGDARSSRHLGNHRSAVVGPSRARASHRSDELQVYRRRPVPVALAAEGGGSWDAVSGPASGGAATSALLHASPREHPPGDRQEGARERASSSHDGDAGQDLDGLLAELLQVVDRIARVDLDATGDQALGRLLAGLRVPATRLEAVRAAGFVALERRAARRAPSGGATAAELEQRRRNARQQRMAPSRAKRVAEAGRAAADHEATGAAFRAGDLSEEHVRLIGSLLRRVPLGQRDALEHELVALARDLDPVAFGRRARTLLISEEPEAARRMEQVAEGNRSVRIADTADGGLSFSGLLHGTAAETARTALQAFRRPDTPDEHRTTEQRNADAFEQLCTAALRLGDAPTVHGVRPHVIVVIEEQDLARDDGLARLAHSGQPVTTGAAGHLLDDCTLSRLVRDASGTPIEVSTAVRTVPAGLFRALLARDGGCTWDGCDAPASWCDVAHGNLAYRQGGRLSPANAALLCRRHHRRFDRGGFRLEIDGGRVRYHRTQPRGRPACTSADPPGAKPADPADAAVCDPEQVRLLDLAPALDGRDPPGRR